MSVNLNKRLCARACGIQAPLRLLVLTGWRQMVASCVPARSRHPPQLVVVVVVVVNVICSVFE